MASKSKRANQNKISTTPDKYLIFTILFVFFKLLIIWRVTSYNLGLIQGKAWLGADGENYLNGANALTKDGIFSTDGVLNYWPAGYPLTIYFLSIFGKTFGLTTLSISQTLIYAMAVLKFIREIQFTRINRFAPLIFLMLTANPTLSLSSICIGYESLAAASFIFLITLLMYDFRIKSRKSLLISLIFISLVLSYASFIQPRFLLVALLIIPTWLISRIKFYKFISLTIGAFILVSFLPATLVYRNHSATGQNTISTNLGNTMNIGAGNTTGGYIPNPPGVKCKTPNPKDSDLVKCVLKWYISNPQKGLKLFWNKSIFFWSPWFGPEANGTMARNPWLTFHPLKNMQKTQDGVNFLYGNFGKFLSWLWMLSYMYFLFSGFVFLWRKKFELRVLAKFSMIIIISSWAVTLLSIGDHRFRLPIMGMSLFLQAVGLQSNFRRKLNPIITPTKLR